jgi:hypothetical protein
VAGDLSVYGLRPLELLVPADGNLLFGSAPRRLLDLHDHGSNPTETSNYVGLLTIVLAVASLALARRRWAALPERLQQAVPGLAALVIVSLVLAAPSPVRVFGSEVETPSRLLWEVLPAFRVPSRWVVLAITALIPLAALALQAGWTSLARRGPRWRGAPVWAIALVGVAVAVSFLELSISPTRDRFSTRPLPAVYKALERVPRGVLAEYPLIPERDASTFWQIFHRRPLLDGAPGGTTADEARRMLVHPAVPGTAAELALLGVTAIVTHPNALDYVESMPDVPDARWGPGYKLVVRAPDGSSLWRVTARPAPALATLPSGFGEPGRPRDGLVYYALTSPSGVGYIGLRAKRASVVRISFQAEPPRGSERVLRVADTNVERSFALRGRTRVEVVAQVPRGFSLLLLKTDPAATSERDAIRVSAPHAERTSASPDFQAQAISPDPGF